MRAMGKLQAIHMSKRVSKVSFDLDNWFARLLYEVQMDYFHDKAARNISDDKRKNLKRKFRRDREYVREPWDELKHREDALYCESSDDYQATLKDVKTNWGVEKFTFEPKTLPG